MQRLICCSLTVDFCGVAGCAAGRSRVCSAQCATIAAQKLTPSPRMRSMGLISKVCSSLSNFQIGDVAKQAAACDQCCRAGCLWPANHPLHSYGLFQPGRQVGGTVAARIGIGPYIVRTTLQCVLVVASLSELWGVQGLFDPVARVDRERCGGEGSWPRFRLSPQQSLRCQLYFIDPSVADLAVVGQRLSFGLLNHNQQRCRLGRLLLLKPANHPMHIELQMAESQ